MKKAKNKSNSLLLYFFLIISFGSLFFSTISQGKAQQVQQATTRVHLTILPNIQPEGLPKRKVTFYPQRIFLEELWENVNGKIYKVLTFFKN